MKKFKDFLEARHWRDWPPESPDDFDYEQFAQQERDLATLKRDIEEWNRYNPGEMMSISTSGEHHENPRDSDHFALYINGNEITSGSLPELMQRVHQIKRERGW